MVRREFTLTELVIVVLILGVFMVWLLPRIASVPGNSPITNCGSNLSQLVKAMYNYSITKSPIEGDFPSGAPYMGGAFWTTLYSTKEIDDPKILICPVMATTPANGTNTDFRGPRTDPNALSKDGILGCDKPGSHGDDPTVAMNWVAKSGDVHKTPVNAAKWLWVVAETRD